MCALSARADARRSGGWALLDVVGMLLVLIPVGVGGLAGRPAPSAWEREVATLVQHLRDGRADVRGRVLETLALEGRRSDALREAVRTCVAASDAVVRERAYEALGRIGDGRDVPLLLAGFSGDEAGAARRGLASLSGMTLGGGADAWRLIWSEVAARAGRSLPRALEGLEAGDDDPWTHRETLRELGWVDVPGVRARIATWPTGDVRRAAEARRIRDVLRLGAPPQAQVVAHAGSSKRWISTR